MVVERRSHEQQPWGIVSELDSREITPSSEFATIEVPFDPHPIIQRLEWQMDVLAGFYLDDHQPAVSIHGQQIDHAPFTRRKLRYLTVDWCWVNGSVQLLQGRPYLGFEPGFGIS